MSETIVFRTEADLPLSPMSVGTTLYNKTGSWRYVRPIYRDKTPPCDHACPAGEDIVDYLSMANRGEYEQALQRILEENPFPGVCGRVCPHPCEADCNRAQLGGAIAIHGVERFLADLPLQRKLPTLEPTAPPGHNKIAVIGSGPAGLSCAYQLARRGYEVTVFEALPVVGGMMRVGIPSYRLPREVLDAEIAAIEALGVDIRTGMRLGKDLSWQDLRAYQAVFVAVGQHRGRKLNVPGEDARGVVMGLDFLRAVNLGEKPTVGPKVAVIGGGNTAMDAARSALRLGAPKVMVLYRRSRKEMPVIAEEIDEAEQEAVQIEYVTAPVEVLTTDGRVTGIRCVGMRLGAPDQSGRRRPEPVAGSEHTMDVDTLIPALGQEADLTFLEEAARTEGGLIAINETGATSRERIFAGGDAATGFGTVAHAIGSGKRAALAIDKWLREKTLEGFPPQTEHVRSAPRDIDQTVVHFEDLNLAYFSEETRTPQPQRAAAERVKDFAEVNLGFTEGGVSREAARCFSCGTCNQCDTCWLYCPDVCILRRDREGYEINYDYCKGCGICAQECPRVAIVIEEELKWKK
ncbi:MAG TPA: NAD(P)-binding protein [Anaerolineae bacterium]|nr:NAD(P)-binding protein [Anaerolineae bacterium]